MNIKNNYEKSISLMIVKLIDQFVMLLNSFIYYNKEKVKIYNKNRKYDITESMKNDITESMKNVLNNDRITFEQFKQYFPYSTFTENDFTTYRQFRIDEKKRISKSNRDKQTVSNINDLSYIGYR
jgi:hypothetical protein